MFLTGAWMIVLIIVMIIVDGFGFRNQLGDNIPCGTGSYRCMGQARRCLWHRQVCDGNKDCPNGDDEFFCRIPDDGSCGGRTLCATDYACVNVSSICDGTDNCPGRGDELACDVRCPQQCRCGGYSLICADVPWNAASASWVSRDTINIYAVGLREFTMNGTEANAGVTTPARSVQECLHLDLTEFQQLKIVFLEDIQIGRIAQDSFSGLMYVHTMALHRNEITTIESRSFRDMSSLRALYLSINSISDLPRNAFDGLSKLEELHLSENTMATLTDNVFLPLESLKILNLMQNVIETMEMGAFRGLRTLQHLYMGTNSIDHLMPGLLRPLGHLKTLHLDNNKISSLTNGSFEGLSALKYLDLSENPLAIIDQGAFNFLPSVNEMYMVLMKTQVGQLHRDMFDGLESLRSLSADDHRFCCLLDAETQCHTPPSPFATCEGLLRHTVLRTFIWILALSAVFGNVFVIFWRYKQRNLEPHNRVQILLILNLAVSDLLMGVYMIMIGSADGYFGQDYFLHADDWRTAGWCTLAGVISVTSSEASVLMITVISVDRCLCIVFPFGRRRLGLASARVTVAAVWVVAGSLSLLPHVIEKYVHGFYGLSDVCVGLPLATKSDYKASWLETDNRTFSFVFDEMDEITPASYYAIFIFVAVSLLCFLVILVCYLAIFLAVTRTARGTGRRRDRDEEVKMAVKMALIVGTDFGCWMPIIIMGLLSQTGTVTIPVKTYAWTMVFVLPINSSINPYLYTISTLVVRRFQGPRKESSAEGSQTVPLTGQSPPPISVVKVASTDDTGALENAR